MPKYRDGWGDPPPSEAPKDWDCSGVSMTGPVYKPGTTWKRALTAAVCAGVIGLIYALIPIAFAVGGAAIGVWFVGAEIYAWLDRKTDPERQ